MSDDRAAQARAEAERDAVEAGTPYLNKAAARAWFGDGVERGVEWADANPQPTTITRDELRAAADEFTARGMQGDWVSIEDMLTAALGVLEIGVSDE